MAKQRWSPRPTLEPQIRVFWRHAPGGEIHKSSTFVGRKAVLNFAKSIEGKLCELWVESDEKRTAKMNPRTRKPIEEDDWLFIDY